MVLSLLLTACDSHRVDRLDTNYRQGVGEMELRFTDSSWTLYEEHDFTIPIVVENTAAYEIRNPILELNADGGLLDIHNPTHELGQSLRGKEGRVVPGLGEFSPVPERADLFVEGFVKPIQTKQDRTPTKPSVILTYSSHFIFEPTVCVGSTLIDIDDGGCRVEDSSNSYSGQGAPVAVTKMDTKVFAGYTGQMQFTMRVRNRGDGHIKSLSLLQSTVGSRELDCFFPDGQTQEQNTVEFHAGKKDTTLICMLDVGDGASFSSPMFLKFDYGYKTVKNLKFTLLKSGVKDTSFFR
jgi:hypothetical protein